MKKSCYFADDSNAFMINKDINKLKRNSEKIFDKLEEWFAANKLTINVDKTNFNIFHPPRKKISQEFNALNIGKTQIGRVDYIRYLGFLLDDQLNWKMHINQLCGNLTKILSAFKLIKRLVPIKFKRHLYYAYCFSRIASMSLWN